MKCSICIATHNKADILYHVLLSILSQHTPFEFEIIVVDDNSTDYTEKICQKYRGCVSYKKLIHSQPYRNPAIARNIAYKMASGNVIICQSDDVVHITKNSVEQLVYNLQPQTFTIATVFNTNLNGDIIHSPLPIFTGQQNQRPLLFLGAVLREDIYKVGGNDELYTAPGFEDNAFADSLIHGLGLTPRYDNEVIGHHIHHVRPRNLSTLVNPSRQRYNDRYYACSNNKASWLSPTAPWTYIENQPYQELYEDCIT